MNYANNNIVQVTVVSNSIENNATIDKGVEDVNTTNNYTNIKSPKWIGQNVTKMLVI